MSLLEQVLTAHGGRQRWEEVRTVTARISYGGPFWAFKGQPGFETADVVEADLRRQRISHVQEGSGRITLFDQAADVVTVRDADGRLVEELHAPRSTFAGYTTETPWTAAQMAYFRAYATWHYLLEPYLFTLPGMETTEVEPWIENGESWRGLSVTFPVTFDTHNPTQLYYFDEEGLLRRMDYQPEVNGFSPTAHYVRKRGVFDGFTVPTKRHVHIRKEDRTPGLSWIPITLDYTDVAFR